MKTLTGILKEVEELPPFWTDDNEYAFQDVDSLLDHCDIDYSDYASQESSKTHIIELEEDWKVEAVLSECEKVHKFDVEELMERTGIFDRIPDDDNYDRNYEKIRDSINECIDFKKLNSLMPEFYYPSRIKFIITKQDLLDYYKIKI